MVNSIIVNVINFFLIKHFVILQFTGPTYGSAYVSVAGGESCRLTRPCLASIAGSARKHAGRTATVSDTVMHDVMEVLMKKIVSAALLAVALFGVTACSSYPGWVPDWAQIGAEEKS